MLGADGWEFLLILPLVASVAVAAPDRTDRVGIRGLLMILLIGGLVLLPVQTPRFVYRGAPLSQFRGMFKVLQSSPPGSRIAGPPDIMVPTIAFGRRPAFNTPGLRTNDVLCRRNEAYWRALFASSPSVVENFMTENDVRYFLVDRLLLKRRDFFGTKGCFRQFRDSIDTSDPYLDREFDGAAWGSPNGRFYLITPGDLRTSNQS